MSENEPQGQCDILYKTKVCGDNFIRGCWCTFEGPEFIGDLTEIH